MYGRILNITQKVDCTCMRGYLNSHPKTLRRLVALAQEAILSIFLLPFSNGVYYLPSWGTNSFLLRQTTFQKDLAVQESKQDVKADTIWKKDRKSSRWIKSSPLYFLTERNYSWWILFLAYKKSYSLLSSFGWNMFCQKKKIESSGWNNIIVTL